MGSPNLEAFFNKVQDTLFKKVNSYYDEIESKQTKKKNSISSKINQLIINLKKIIKVLVLTDTRNSFRAIEICQYIK